MNKIHHKTLEAMKRKEALAENAEVIIPSEEITPDTKIMVEKETLDKQNALIERQAKMLESLAERLSKVEDEADTPNIEVSKSKLVEWPRMISFYTFSTNGKNIPIIDYYSKKKKEEYSSLHFKNQYWVMENNQIVVTKLADGTEREVDSLYIAQAEVSEPAIPLYVIDKKGTKFPWDSESIWAADDQKRINFLKQVSAFVFDSEWGEITIPLKLIAGTKVQLKESL